MGIDLDKLRQQAAIRWQEFQSQTKERLNQVNQAGDLAGELWEKQKVWILSGSIAIVLIFYIGRCLDAQKYNNAALVKASQDSQGLQDLEELRQSLAKVYSENDPLVREYTLQKEAVKLKKNTHNYRELFKIYRKNKELLPQYPVVKWSVLAWYSWFFKEVTPVKQNELIKNGILILIEKGILIAGFWYVGRWLWEAPQRKKQEQYQAWQIIHLAKGETVSGARKQALEDLNRQKISLAALSAEQVDLKEIHLEKADLSNANLSGADLSNANLGCADLSNANLGDADLSNANLGGADLSNANLSGAKLCNANLSGVDLSNAKLCNANLSDANLNKANLSRADLSNANLSGAKLSTAKNLTEEQVQTVRNWERH
ncbi:hypothetical protein WA1_20130 [Scytonema hofmannii PCC 7110]|uniref:Low-complexity protein n=1 Tax=Scytonema hofmannii PCC 7110 TaxID=128403 RepID=A0A139XC63_9CYAN|nr:pentapeptide repeat-containing protein [Scytonema hofmannii]KYC42287.1 hypothetical protein WA1_20130 [Scytonema hofmannii PCC 7110]